MKIKQFFPILLSSFLFAGPTLVTEILFEGNENTKDFILLREINHSINIPLDTLLAEQGRERLLNLGLFLQVDWYTSQKNTNESSLIYNVVENIRILPGVLPVYSDETGWGLLLSVTMTNFRGLNETLRLGGKIGRLSSLRFSFYDPWIYGNHGSLGLSVADERLNHSFLSNNIHTKEFSINTGRYWNYKYRGGTGFSISQKDVYDVNKIKIDTLAHASAFVSGTIDTRNIYSHPTRGSSYTTAIRFLGDITGEKRHVLYWFQNYSTFKTIQVTGTTFGFNIGSNLTFITRENILINAIGGSYSVRGWSFPDRKTFQEDEFRFGFQKLNFSVEARQSFTSQKENSLLDEFGLEGATFIDLGWISKNINLINVEKPMIGIGFGLRMNFPVVQVIRFDYAWGFYDGKNMDRSFHLGFGQKF